ncbi:helix-turn-helix domain-containing protein [Streptomyces sp. NPDC093094]|uniref:helix-turn-helix domain-containing protein n=1 Tax=Streptomyces sp. NPDC093094 TaxID=3366026 RepID=UPI00380FE83B
MDESEEPAAYAYAAALRKAVNSYRNATGKSQKTVAADLHLSASTLSRYLSGERLAPREILSAVRAYVEAQGMPLPRKEAEELDELCEQAHLSSRSPAVRQLARLREDLTHLRKQHQQALHIAEARSAEVQEHADRLASQLERSLARAQTAEDANRILRNRGTERDEKLRHAQRCTRGIEAEIAQQREQTRLLLQEVGVLREQNRRLLEEQQTVPAPSTQVDRDQWAQETAEQLLSLWDERREREQLRALCADANRNDVYLLALLLAEKRPALAQALTQQAGVRYYDPSAGEPSALRQWWAHVMRYRLEPRPRLPRTTPPFSGPDPCNPYSYGPGM